MSKETKRSIEHSITTWQNGTRCMGCGNDLKQSHQFVFNEWVEEDKDFDPILRLEFCQPCLEMLEERLKDILHGED